MSDCWQMKLKDMGTYVPGKDELNTDVLAEDKVCEIGGKRAGKKKFVERKQYKMSASNSGGWLGLFRREAVILLHPLWKLELVEVTRLKAHLLGFHFKRDAWDGLGQKAAIEWMHANHDPTKEPDESLNPEPPKYRKGGKLKGKARYEKPHGDVAGQLNVLMWLQDKGSKEWKLYQVTITQSERGSRA